MSQFSASAAGYRLFMQHPVPWRYMARYESGHGPAEGAILDAEDKVVVKEGRFLRLFLMLSGRCTSIYFCV